MALLNLDPNGLVPLLLSIATTPGIWLLRWLLFRFMFMSGVVKLLSGDPNWWNLSALSDHFLTQPLPTTLAWYAARLPPGLLQFATGGTFFVELILPFLIFCPRRLRFFAAFGILLLQGCILITGNYNWFNLQTMLLCLPLFDDAAIRRISPRRLARLPQARNQAPHRAVTVVVNALALLIVFCSLVRMDERFGGSPPVLAQVVEGFIGPLHVVSDYGLFAVMTTKRYEIVIEGSYDGAEWRDYEFRYKPGDVTRPPRWNIPDQPRLDWQMWFAALDDPARLPWFSRFLARCSSGSFYKFPVLGLREFHRHDFGAQGLRRGVQRQNRWTSLDLPVDQGNRRTESGSPADCEHSHLVVGLPGLSRRSAKSASQGGNSPQCPQFAKATGIGIVLKVWFGE